MNVESDKTSQSQHESNIKYRPVVADVVFGVEKFVVVVENEVDVDAVVVVVFDVGGVVVAKQINAI